MSAVGVLALQGGFEAHLAALSRAGAPGRAVRRVAELVGLDALVMPGGESTTLLNLMTDEPWFDALRAFHANGGALFGTRRTPIDDVMTRESSLLGGAVTVGLPLVLEARTIGELELFVEGSPLFVADDLALLQLIARRAILAAEREEVLAERERLIEVNGERSVDEVTWSVIVQLQKAQRLLAE